MKKFYVFRFYAEKNILLQEMVGELAPPSPLSVHPFPTALNTAGPFSILGEQNKMSTVLLRYTYGFKVNLKPLANMFSFLARIFQKSNRQGKSGEKKLTMSILALKVRKLSH